MGGIEDVVYLLQFGDGIVILGLFDKQDALEHKLIDINNFYLCC